MTARTSLCASILVATVYLVCACSAASPQTTQPSRPTADATTRPATSSDAPGLISSLDKPYEDAYFKDRGIAGWTELLRHARTRDDHPFDVASRDRVTDDIRKIVAPPGSKSAFQVLILESVSKNGPNSTEYDRVALFMDTGGPPGVVRSLSALGLRRVKPDEFRALQEPLRAAMAAKGSNNGVKSVSDSVDAMVITHYDGAAWQMETWFWVQTAPYVAESTGLDREALPPPLGVLIDLIEAAQPYGSKANGFGPPTYRELIKSFPKRVRLADPK